MALSDQITKAVATYIWGTGATGAALSTATTAIEYYDGGFIDLIVKKAPIISVVSVFDVSASATVTSTAYGLYTATGTIYKNNGSKWGNSGERRRFKITYTYGYTTIPDDIQLAIDTWVNYLTADSTGALSGYSTGDDSETYNQSVSVSGMPSTVKKLLAPYKRMLF